MTITGLLEAWWEEAQATAGSRARMRVIGTPPKNLVRFLGHNDAARVAPEDVIAFKDHRLVTPSTRSGRVTKPKTVKDSDLTALKALFGWAVTNRKLPTNPAAGITIKLAKPRRIRSKGFTDAEARAILAAALNCKPGKERPGTAAAKRWVPWLCAFTGARVGEVGQLRRQDVRCEEGLWIIHITPEAGTVKTDEARDVVLHPQLVELGFPAFVGSSEEGHLFLGPGLNGEVLGPL